MQRTLRFLFLASLAGTGFAASVGATPPTSAPSAREPSISGEGPAGEYLKRIHERIHARWTRDDEAYGAAAAAAPDADKAASSRAPSAPHANDSTLQVTVAVAIRWDGTIADMTLESGSGVLEFDRHASDVVRRSGPFPLPPQEVVSDDGYAHIEWTLARDYRACGAGARVARVEDPLAVSLPRLLQSHRVPEAIRRVGEAINRGSPDALDRFARLFLSRSIPDPLLDVEASVALAGAGDRTQIPRLSEALTWHTTADTAAGGLRRLGVDVCLTLQPVLQSGPRAAREVALETLRGEARSGIDLATCREGLVALVTDGQQPVALRLLAFDTAITFLAATVKPVIALGLRDAEPALRGAAILASVRKGGGRPELYRLAPMLHDKTVEVRAAASAGIVRAAGDQALEQLYLLARETDPRPAQAVAAELAQLGSTASAEFLAKMARRPSPAVQLAAARALLVRQDAAAKAQLAGLPTDLVAEARALASPSTRSPPKAIVTLGGTPPRDASAPSATAAALPAGSVAEASPREQVERLLGENHARDAASWIVGHWATISPADEIAVLGTWLARGSASAPPATADSKAGPAASALSASTH